MRAKFYFFIIFFPILAHATIKVAITVDDLPDHSAKPNQIKRVDIAKKMLKAFKKYEVPEVYGFINAEKVDQDPNLLKVLNLWVDAGYPLGNHAYSHKSLSDLTVESFKQEIDGNEILLQKLNGSKNWHYFRYPFLREGETIEKRNAIRKYLASKGYTIAQVTIDFEDWSWNPPYARCKDKNNKEQIKWLQNTYLKNAVDQLRRASIISKSLFGRDIAHILLLHIGAFDAEMLGDLLKAYKKEGVEFIPLSQAVKDEVYTIDPAIATKRGSELTYQIMQSRGLTLTDVGLEKYSDYSLEKLNSTCN